VPITYIEGWVKNLAAQKVPFVKYGAQSCLTAQMLLVDVNKIKQGMGNDNTETPDPGDVEECRTVP
jgi:hypothetical protein